MSRSYKKTPITEHTTCRSEKLDKRFWHKKWHSKERIKLADLTLENLDNHSTTDRREVSNPWDMGKDGKHYFAPHEQKRFIKSITTELCRSLQECSSLKKRLLHKWMGK